MNPSLYGELVRFVDRVCPANPSSTSPTPTGTVTFQEGDMVLARGVLFPVGGTGPCSMTMVVIRFMRLGTHTVTALYSGDVNYSSGPLESVRQSVRRRLPTA
ncbi:Ig-like domain-containing protein [Streptomyces sp. IMTB 2501]|uniref:Ig-like domain-containing protein n=1 Tax=Streptomyces sp. IMTB 2501 TaxID=1776340 RepID=UPI0035322F63